MNINWKIRIQSLVKDPTTKGLGDSDRAMSYTERV